MLKTAFGPRAAKAPFLEQPELSLLSALRERSIKLINMRADRAPAYKRLLDLDLLSFDGTHVELTPFGRLLFLSCSHPTAEIARLYPNRQARRAFLWTDGWAGRCHHPVLVVGETARRFRIRVRKPNQWIRLPSGGTLRDGETASVSKCAVTMSFEQPDGGSS